MTEEISSINNQVHNSTFERLHELQILLKKESAMKELCKIYNNSNYIKYSYKNKRRNTKTNKRRMYIYLFKKIRGS
jgi:hypothetical protein